MRQYFLKRWSLVRLELQHLHNETFEILAKISAELVVPQFYFLFHLVKIFCRKGRVTVQQLIQQNPQGPVIDGIVVFLFKDHFWCHILISSTESFSLHLNIVSGPAQVAYFDVAGIVEEDVFGLTRNRSTLMSRCMMSWEWRYRMAERVWLKNLKVYASLMVLCLFWYVKRVPFSASSMTIYTKLFSIMLSHSLMICG
jgi:hypothetical protein